MSKSIYEEAIAEAKLLQETAEQNAKNAIIEAVTPKIREFIEDQLLDQESRASKSSDILSEVASNIVNPSGEDHVELDETALGTLLELFGGESVEKVKNDPRFKSALRESFETLGTKNKKNLMSVMNKLQQNADFLQSEHINNDIQSQKENFGMSKNSEMLYEVDLDELAGIMERDGSMKHDDSKTGRGEDYIGEMADEMDGDDLSELQDVELEEALRLLGVSSLDEARVVLDIPDVEIPAETMMTAMLDEDDEELEDEDLESAELDDLEDDIDVDIDAEDEEDLDLEMPESLDEVFEIDPNVLKSELLFLRKKIREAKDLSSAKGIKNTMEHHFGGKGNSKSGLKGSYGGTGTSKSGVDGSYGGGKGTGDPLKVKINKLSEAYSTERRKNRSLSTKLVEYRSAVETLREQLTDLNLFNAKLLYVNKILQNKDVTSSQKRSVVESIDKAKTLREVKLIFKTLTESFGRGRDGVLSESRARRVLGSSSRTTSKSSAENVSAEVNRWATLAGIKN
jgi:hypothetical protein